jgi:hypothetical protein
LNRNPLDLVQRDGISFLFPPFLAAAPASARQMSDIPEQGSRLKGSQHRTKLNTANSEAVTGSW